MTNIEQIIIIRELGQVVAFLRTRGIGKEEQNNTGDIEKRNCYLRIPYFGSRKPEIPT